MGRLQELLDKVEEKNPEKALELLLKLSEFAIPKLRAIEVNNESEDKHTSLNINIIDTVVSRDLFCISNLNAVNRSNEKTNKNFRNSFYCCNLLF